MCWYLVTKVGSVLSLRVDEVEGRSYISFEAGITVVRLDLGEDIDEMVEVPG